MLDYEWSEILPFSSVTGDELMFDNNLGFEGVHVATCFLNLNFLKHCEHIRHVNFDFKKGNMCLRLIIKKRLLHWLLAPMPWLIILKIYKKC